MIRCRLRSNTGCVQCRTRRKKCDEAKPVCEACKRLRLPCSWKSLEQPIRNSLVADVAAVVHAPSLSTTHPPSLRLPDFVSARRSDQVEIQDLKGFIEATSMRDSSLYDLDICSLPDLVVQGVRKGWRTIPDHPDLDYMTYLDRHIESCGHGQAARVAFSWLYLILQTCFQRWRRGEVTAWHMLPPWYIPLQMQVSQTVQILDSLNFIVWPSLRQRMLDRPFTYCNNQFLHEVMSNGVRFIWPYSYAEIVTVDQETGRYDFSDEFSMRVSNLRSFVLTKDFLERHPELRGDAAQLEPSVTTYQLSETSIAETIFWTKLREARQRKTEGNGSQAEPQVEEQAEVIPPTEKDQIS